MFYIVKFEHHYNNDEEWYWECEVLIKALDSTMIKDYLKVKYPDGYIRIISISDFKFNDGDIIEITPNYGPIG